MGGSADELVEALPVRKAEIRANKVAMRDNLGATTVMVPLAFESYGLVTETKKVSVAAAGRLFN